MSPRRLVVVAREVVRVRLEGDEAPVARDDDVGRAPSPPGPVGPSARLTRVVVSASKSRTKTSSTASSSSAERLSAVGDEGDGAPVGGERGGEARRRPPPRPPDRSRDSRARSWRRRGRARRGRSGTRGRRPRDCPRWTANATTRPSAEIEAANELPSPPAPPAAADWRLTRVVVWACRSRTKTSSTRVLRRQVVGERVEGDVAPVGRDRRVEGSCRRPRRPVRRRWRLTSVVVWACRSRT